MRIAFLSAFILLGVVGNTQFTNLHPKYFDQTLNSTVLVVLNHSDSLNDKIKSGFEKYWKATPYRFVTSNYADTIQYGKGKPIYSVFEGTIVKTINVISDELGRERERGTFGNWAAYFLAPLDKQKKPDVELSMAWGPSNMFYYEWSPEQKLENTFYRVEYIIKQVNDVLTFRKQNPKANANDFRAFVYAKTNRLKSKTLIVPKELLEKYDIWKITRAQMETGVGKVYTSKKPIFMSIVDQKDLSGYGGKIKVMSYAEIDRLAQSSEANQYALFSPLVNDQKYIFVFDLATKEMLFTDSGLMSNQVNKKDIKQLNEVAGF